MRKESRQRLHHALEHLVGHREGDLVGLEELAVRGVPAAQDRLELAPLQVFQGPGDDVGAAGAEGRLHGLEVVGDEGGQLVEAGDGFGPGEEDHHLGFFVRRKFAQLLEDAELLRGRPGVERLKEPAHRRGRVQVAFAFHHPGLAGGDVMGDELQLGLEEPQVEGAPQAAEASLVEAGRLARFAGPPEHPDDAGEVGEGRLPIHLAGRLHGGGGQDGLLRRQTLRRVAWRCNTSPGVLRSGPGCRRRPGFPPDRLEWSWFIPF